MEIANDPGDKSTEIVAYDKLYMENTLLRIAGALFCHDAKRASTRASEIEINKGLSDKNITIRPDPELGQPGPLAHRIFVALIKKHSDYGRPIQKDVSFTKRELMRLAGRKTWGGSDSEQLSRALMQIQTTLISANFKVEDGRYVEETFHVFSRTRIERRESAGDPIEACTITLADPIIASLKSDHFTCLNHGLMMRQGTIGQALYMRLFFHFANLHNGNNAKHLVFQKRYDDICNEWLGGLIIVEHRSKILDRLGSHLQGLVEENFLASYAVEKARSREGFVMTFRPGETFFEDYDRFYRQRHQSDDPKKLSLDQHKISESLKVAYLFAEKRTGQAVSSVAFVPTRDVETAKQLLAELPLGEMPAFIDFALREAKKTAFDVKTLGGIKQYLAPYLVHMKRQLAIKAGEVLRQAKEREEDEQSAYNCDRRSEAADLFKTLPPDERASIDAQARSFAARFGGTLGDSMYAHRKVQITTKRHADRLKSFEQWRSERLAA